jgi:endonuclease G
LDPVWGSNFKDANEDTFHFSNCSPQHKNLNQKTWSDLEDYILRNADVHDLKVNVFTGPVFNQNDLI